MSLSEEEKEYVDSMLSQGKGMTFIGMSVERMKCINKYIDTIRNQSKRRSAQLQENENGNT